MMKSHGADTEPLETFLTKTRDHGCELPGISNLQTIRDCDEEKKKKLVILPLKSSTLRLLESLNALEKNVGSEIMPSKKLARSYFCEHNMSDRSNPERPHNPIRQTLSELGGYCEDDSSSSSSSSFSLENDQEESLGYYGNRGMSFFGSSGSSRTTTVRSSAGESDGSINEEFVKDDKCVHMEDDKGYNSRSKSCTDGRLSKQDVDNVKRQKSAPASDKKWTFSSSRLPNLGKTLSNFVNSQKSELTESEMGSSSVSYSDSDDDLSWETLDCLPVVECAQRDVDQHQSDGVITFFRDMGTQCRNFFSNSKFWVQISEPFSSFGGSLADSRAPNVFSFNLAIDELMWNL